jgi:photosystem II stability/assembly factor-like uncharacterized protein
MENNYNTILYITLLSTKKYQIGRKDPQTGLFYGNGFNNIWCRSGWGKMNSITIDEKSDGRIIYAACGNGVMQSKDYGKTWKILTDHSMTEVLKVAIDPLNNDILYASGAYGVFKSIDAGKTWNEKNKGRKTPFSNHILINRKRILLATEEGLYLSINKAESWDIIGLNGKGVRSLVQPENDPNVILCGTENDGVFISKDAGKTFSQINQGLNHKTIYAIAIDPNNSEVIYCGGYKTGIYKSINSGDSWLLTNDKYSDLTIHAIKVFPKDSNIVFVGSCSEGLFRSDNAGNDWENISGDDFEKGQIGDIIVYKEAIVNHKPKTEILNKRIKQYKYDAQYSERRIKLLEEIANGKEFYGIFTPLSKIILGKDIDIAYQEIEQVLEEEKVKDMFLLQQLTHAYLYCGKYMSERLRAKIRDAFKNKQFYRGDTENHYVLYYASLYLLAQEFPDLPGSEWFTGKSAKTNFAEAKSYLISWMDITTTIGQGEFDSPTYHPIFLVALLGLYDFADNEKMKKKAQIMLDYLFADWAVENLKGFYCGGHSRDYAIPHNITDPRTAPMAIWSYLLFGQSEYPVHARDYGLLFYPIVSSYELPEIIYRIATDRSKPYYQTKTKRVRNIFRFCEEKNPPVYKSTYMSKNFALGSLMGGAVLQPLQQHTWDVTFVNGKPYNTIFSLHPYADPTELGMFFPEEMKFMVEEVHKNHKIYASPDKWASGSPYEKTFQYNNSIIVLYDIKPGVLYKEIDAHFPKSLKQKIEHPSGWIFCDAETTYIAYYPFKPYEWIEEEESYRLRSKHLKNGCVLEVAESEDYNSFDDFIKQIVSNKIDISSFDEKLKAVYVNSVGDELNFSYYGDRELNGERLHFETYKLFKGLFLYAEIGSKKLEIRYENRTRYLDLNKVSIEEKKLNSNSKSK